MVRGDARVMSLLAVWPAPDVCRAREPSRAVSEAVGGGGACALVGLVHARHESVFRVSVQHQYTVGCEGYR